MTLFYSGYDMYTCTWMHAMKSEILVPQHAQSKMLKFIQTDISLCPWIFDKQLVWDLRRQPERLVERVLSPTTVKFSAESAQEVIICV